MDYHVFTLPSGLRLLYKPSESSVTHACILINAGSRNEPEGKDGLAHFIEHLLFKRTAKRSTGQILNYLESVGGDLNAYTTKEYTCIHASFLNPFLKRAFDLFGDLVFHSTFPLSEMEKEKSVILDEIASYQDQPEEAIQDDFEDLIFAGHALGRNILGTAASVESLQQADIFSFLSSSYNTEEIVVGVSGKYNFKELTRTFTKYYSAVPHNRPVVHHQSPPQYQSKTVRLEKTIAQTHCVLGTRAYSVYHKHKTGLLLLNNILGGNGMTSMLNLTIREKYGIAYTIESNYTPFSDTGIFSIYLGTDEEKAEKAIRLVHKQLKLLRENKMGELALGRAKKKLNGFIALGEDNRMGLIIAMAKNLIDYNRSDSLEEVFERVNRVTSAQLLEIANEILDPSAISMLIFEPGGEA